MKGRTPPAPTAAQTQQAELMAALRDLNIPDARLWAERHGVELSGGDDVVLRVLHQMRVDMPAVAPRLAAVSRRWLRENA